MSTQSAAQQEDIAVVLLSGGMDSCVTLAHAIHDGYAIAALHVNYGQRTQDRELRAFNDICDHYNITRRLIVDISHLAAIGGSSLTDSSLPLPTSTLPTSTPAHQHTVIVPTSYVPFRNANILAIATSWAEVIDAHALYIGAVEEDSSGYPDCRESFFRSFQTVIDEGTKPETSITIKTPVIHHSKAEIVRDGQRLQAPLHLSWSCYRNNDRACGTCDSCRLRLRGFAAAGLTDPIPYDV